MTLAGWLLLAGAALILIAVFLLAPKGWRTIAVSVAQGLIVAAGPVLDYLAVFDWTTILPANAAPLVAVIFACSNIALRAITNTPLGRKE